MINRCRNKLKENTGSSMILVLALFLICVMVSSVIIATAASGSSRNLRRTTQQRAYLAVSSATDLLVEEFRVMGSFVGKRVEKQYGCRDCTVAAGVDNGYWLEASLIPNNMNEGYIIFIEENHEESGTKVVVDESATTLTGPLGELMKRGTQSVYDKHTSYTESFTIALNEAEEERLPEVTCKFTVDEEYRVTIEVTTADSDYTVMIEAQAGFATTETTNTDISCTHRIYYKELNTEEGAFENRYANLDIAGEQKESIITVNWGPPIVTKGVDSK